MTDTGMVDPGMTVSPRALRELGAALAMQGHRVRGLGVLLADDADLAGSRARGELIHGAALWREELEREGDGVEQLGLAAADIAAEVEGADGTIGAALCPTSR